MDDSKEKENSVFPQRKESLLKSSLAAFLGFSLTMIIAYVTGVVLEDLMAAMRNTFLYYAIPFLISLSLFFTLIWKTSIQKVYGLNYLAGFVLMIALSDLFRLLSGSSIENTLPYLRGGMLFPSLVDLMLPLAVLFLFLHIELVNSDRPKLIRSIFIFSTALPLLVSGILQMFIDKMKFLEGFIDLDTLKMEVEGVSIFFLLLFSLVILAISLDGFHIMYKTHLYADSKSISRASFMMMTGFSSLITNFVLLGLRDSISLSRAFGLQSLQSLNVHTSYILMGSLFLILLAYIFFPEFAYSVPFDVYQVIVIKRENGTTLFSYVNEFTSRRSNVKLEISLKSPALVAIETLLEEITHAQGVMEHIHMSDRILQFKTVEEITVVAIADRSSYFLNKGLTSFAKAFYQKFEKEIEGFMGKVSIFERGSYELLYKHLPFFRKSQR